MASVNTLKPPEWAWASPHEFLAHLFADSSIVQYIMDGLKPDTLQDLQLAESEQELKSWLPDLQAPQVRKLWRAVTAVNSRRRRSQGSSDNSDNDDPGPTRRNSSKVFGPSNQISNYEDIWPMNSDKYPFVVQRSHFFRPNLLWLDLSAEHLDQYPHLRTTGFSTYVEELASVFSLHPATVKDCLPPTELPKTELMDGMTFCILRYCVDKPIRSRAVDATDVSTKLSLIITQHPQCPDVDVVILLHMHSLRTEDSPHAFQGYHELQAKKFLQNCQVTRNHLVNTLIEDVLETYRAAMSNMRQAMDSYEKNLTRWTRGDITTELYAVRRRSSVYKRLLQETSDAIEKYVRHQTRDIGPDPFTEDLRDSVRSLLFNIEDLCESTTELLNLHMSLVDHHSNHLLYVLTILSVLFTPTTFICSWYGMNFEQMPEIHWYHGYQYCVILNISAVTLTIGALWRYGFIGHEPTTKAARVLSDK